MSFGVILAHFWVPSGENALTDTFLNGLATSAVPVFTTISFYFSGKLIERCEWESIGNRIIRLAKPFLLWPVLLFVSYNIFFSLYEGKMRYGITELGYQYLFGHTTICGVMYFNWIIIVITVLFAVIFHLFRQKGQVVILILGMLSAIMVYSGKNYMLFSVYPYELKFPLGRVAELLLFAILGMILAHLDYEIIIEKLKQSGIYYLVYGVLVFELVFLFKELISLRSYQLSENFGYGYPDQFVIAGILFILGYSFRENWIYPPIKKAICFISRYTAGIYCVHYFIGKAVGFFQKGSGVRMDSFLMCIIIFFISFIVVFGISKLPWRWCKDITT